MVCVPASRPPPPNSTLLVRARRVARLRRAGWRLRLLVFPCDGQGKTAGWDGRRRSAVAGRQAVQVEVLLLESFQSTLDVPSFWFLAPPCPAAADVHRAPCREYSVRPYVDYGSGSEVCVWTLHGEPSRA